MVNGGGALTTQNLSTVNVYCLFAYVRLKSCLELLSIQRDQPNGKCTDCEIYSAHSYPISYKIYKIIHLYTCISRASHVVRILASYW